MLEKVPLFALSAASCAVTYAAQQQGGAMRSLGQYSPWVRAGNALVSYGMYLWKTLWPSSLAVFYPHPGAALPLWQVAVGSVLLGGISFLAYRCRGRYPYVPVGWLWYVGTLVPVIGLVQVGVQSMADRYTYVPLVGLFVIVAWGVPELLSGFRWRKWALGAAGGIAVSALAVASWGQAGYWRDSFTLFGHGLAVTEDNWLAHNNMGTLLLRQDKVEEAVVHLREALRINPRYYLAHINMSTAMWRQGRFDEAIMRLRDAMLLNPEDSMTHNNMGIMMAQQGRIAEASMYYRNALRIDPGYPEAHYNPGKILHTQGKVDEAPCASK